MLMPILVELDALLDTRLGAMNRFSPQLSCRVVEDPGYYSRVIDDFEKYGQGTTSMWRNVYDQRDVDVLERSRPTLILPWLAEHIRTVHAGSLDNPVYKGCAVAINTWPYVLPEEDRQEIALALSELMLPAEESELPYLAEFSTTCLSPKELTLEKLRDYSMVISYNFHQWYDTHAAIMLKSSQGATHTMFIVPALFKELPNRRDLTDPEGGVVNPFQETRRWLATSLQLHFWDARLFSLPSPFELAKAQ